MQLTIPSTEDIQNVVRIELQNFFSKFQLQPIKDDGDEIGGIDLAMKITGLAKPTIYQNCSDRKIPHFKQGKTLYFSKNDLLKWLRDGKRKTQAEIADEAKQRN